MNRTRQVAAGLPTNRELTMGLVGAIISLAITMVQNMTEEISDAALLQAVAPIQQMLGRLVHRLQMLPGTPAAARTPAILPRGAWKSTPRRAAQVKPRKLELRSGPAAKSFEIPPGWREISNLDDYLNDSSWEDQSSSMDDSSFMGPGMGSEGTFDETPMMSDFEYSYDEDYYPSYNRAVAPLEASDQFQPIHHSTQRGLNQSYARAASPSSAQPLPKRVEQLRSPSRKTFRKMDGTYAVRETINTTNPDGSFQRVTKTVSGPDVSIIQHLGNTAAELPSLSRNRTIPSTSPATGPNSTFEGNATI